MHHSVHATGDLQGRPFTPHGATAQAYGVFDEALGCAIRATFVIDREGTIVDAFETENLGVAREKARYAEALAKL